MAEVGPPEPVKIAVIGAGAFGTAMAVLAARNGNDVKWWCRNAEQRDIINATHKNAKAKGVSHLPLPESLVAVPTVEEACAGATIILHALPAQKTPDFIREHRDVIPADAVFCSTAKGLFLEKKCLLSTAMLEAFEREQPIAILSGPSFAAQIIEAHPSAVVVASKMLYHAVAVQRALSSLTFRVYTSQDVVGVELGGSLKNPLAIGAGMVEGTGFGINTMAAFVTRACRELNILSIAMGGKPETINGLSGIGDLMLTAFGELSRNRSCGMRLSQGETVADITKDSTVEGIPTAEVAMHFAKMCNLELPIFAAVAGVLDGTIQREDVAKKLMSRPLGSE